MLIEHIMEPLGLRGKMRMVRLSLQHSLSIKMLVVYGSKKLPDFIRWVINNKNIFSNPLFRKYLFFRVKPLNLIRQKNNFKKHKKFFLTNGERCVILQSQ
jgi:hypothetical protein